MITVLRRTPRPLWRLAVRYKYARTAGEASAVQRQAVAAYGWEAWGAARDEVLQAIGRAA